MQAVPQAGARSLAPHEAAGRPRGASAGPAPAKARARVPAVDLLRGLLVALMVLDHVREYFSAAALQFEPTDTLRTTAALFVTRWVTHLCAPTFVFLSGLSVHIQAMNGRTGMSLARRLLARGAWLILLEVTLIGFGFNFAEPFAFLQVIWTIGFAMILLAPIATLPRPLIAAGGALLVALDLQLAGLAGPHLPAPLVDLLFVPGPIQGIPGVVAYPALPWAGIFLLGYGLAPLLLGPGAGLRRRALGGAAILLATFVALRLAGVGDLRSWGEGATPALRTLSFINVTKYPPTAQYACLTLGVSGLLLAAFSDVDARRLPMLRSFGRAPFFTYVLHIYVVHGSAMLLGIVMGFPAGAFVGFIERTAALKAAGWGFGLAAVLAIWAATLLVLPPAAIRFAALKDARSDWWISYL